MKYVERIEKRASIREYKGKEISQKLQEELFEFYRNEIHRLDSSIHTELRIFTDDAKNRLEGVAGYRGQAFGAPAYLVLLSEKKEYYLENAGYMGEDMILKLVDMDLDSCWITVDDSDAVKKALLIESDLEVATVIAFGYGKKETAVNRLDIQTPASVKFTSRKGHVAPKISQEDLAYKETWGTKMDWDTNAVDPLIDKAIHAASLSPSFFNRQPYRFVFFGKTLIAFAIKDEVSSNEDILLDVGAMLLNFMVSYEEYGSLSCKWNLGEPENISEIHAPDNYKAVGYFNM